MSSYDYYNRPRPSAGANYLSSAYMNVGGFNLPSAMVSPAAIGNLMRYSEITNPVDPSKAATAANSKNSKKTPTPPKKAPAKKKAAPAKKAPARKKRRA